MWQANLIKLYCTVRDNSSTIETVMQRQSNNFRPQYSDEECITVYLWGIRQRRFEQKTIYEYTRKHLLEWFPKLPGYQAFSDQLNKLAPAFQALAEQWLSVIGVGVQEHMEYIVDSCPVMKYEGVIFDLDGVRCATNHYYYLAWKVLADAIGVPFDESKNDLRGVS